MESKIPQIIKREFDASVLEIKRINEAYKSDKTVTIIGADELGKVSTRPASKGTPACSNTRSCRVNSSNSRSGMRSPLHLSQRGEALSRLVATVLKYAANAFFAGLTAQGLHIGPSTDETLHRG